MKKGDIKLWMERLEYRLYSKAISNNDTILHEVIRGIINKLLCPDYCNKVIKEEILQWIKNINEDVRNKIWNKRCEKIKNKEKKLGSF